MSTSFNRRRTDAGWVDNGHKLQTGCRWCGGTIPDGRRTFCSPACVHEWKLRTNVGYMRKQVFARDRGVCARCGLDTEKARNELRRTLKVQKVKLGSAQNPRWAEECARRNMPAHSSWWHADHIVPVVEGGGECDLSNIRTLCAACHKVETRQLQQKLARQRKTQ